jgi:hypothetical protein
MYILSVQTYVTVSEVTYKWLHMLNVLSTGIGLLVDSWAEAVVRVEREKGRG